MLPLPFQRRPERTKVEDVLCYGTRCYFAIYKKLPKMCSTTPTCNTPQSYYRPLCSQNVDTPADHHKTCLTESCFVHPLLKDKLDPQPIVLFPPLWNISNTAIFS